MDDQQSFYDEVGRRIREARRRRKPKLTQQGLADLVSLTRTSITNVEKGRQKLMLHTLAAIASALDVEPASLLPNARSNGSTRQLEESLKGRPREEKDWIRSTVTAAQHEEGSNGS